MGGLLRRMTYDAEDAAKSPMLQLSPDEQRSMAEAELARRHSDEIVSRLLAKGYLTMVAT